MKKILVAIILFCFLNVNSYSHLKHYAGVNYLEYDLYRNNTLIGSHKYDFIKKGDNLTVKSVVNFKITKLGVDLYKYFAESSENYEKNIFKSFNSTTIQNKKNKYVKINLNKDQKAAFIEKIASEHVDIDALGLYTLGELRKSSSEVDITNYQKSFEKYFLKSLTSRLTDYSSSKFEVLGYDKKSSNYTIVNSKVTPSDGGPEIKIDWRIYTKNPEKPLIRDLIVEGLSLARTQKEEFSSILSSNNNDIKILINKLDNFINN